MNVITNQIGAVTTTATAPADNYEVSVPFRFNPSGDVTTESNEVEIARQHLLTIAFTSPGERVMEPSFGIGLQNLVFSNGDLATFQAVAQQLQQAYSVIDTGYIVTSVTAGPSSVVPGEYVFTLVFQLNAGSDVHQAVFDFQGTLVGAS